MSIEELNMNKAEKLIKNSIPILGIAFINFDYERSSQAFCTCMDFTCLLWTLLVKK